MLKRDYYISQLEPFYTSILVKFLVGSRGSGKTTIFSQIINDLKVNKIADEFHIISINLEYMEFEKYRDRKILENFIRKKIIDEKDYFIFIDEIQHIHQFEILLKSLSSNIVNINLFVASSCSRLLSNEISSVLYGRYKLFYVTPLSYTEACKHLNTEPKNKNMLLNYLKYGGLPARFEYRKSSEVKKYLYSVLDSIFLREIVERFHIFDIDKLYFTLRFLVSKLGKPVRFEDFQEYAKANNKNFSDVDFYSYIDALKRSLIIGEVRGYSVITQKYLQGANRFYFCDLGLATLFGLDVQNNMNLALKNLIWLELKRRGYDVYNGVNGEYYFDFVAIRKEKIIYMQVENLLEDGKSVNEAIDRLDSIECAKRPRFLLSLNTNNLTKRGVIHKNIFEFLLEDTLDIGTEDDEQEWIAVE